MAIRHQVVWAKVAVTDRTKPEAPVEHIFEKGQLLPEFVRDYELFVLTTSGAVKAVDGPDFTLVPDLLNPAPVVLPEHNPELIDAVNGLPASPGPVKTVTHVGERSADLEPGKGREVGPEGTTGLPVTEDGRKAFLENQKLLAQQAADRAKAREQAEATRVKAGEDRAKALADEEKARARKSTPAKATPAKATGSTAGNNPGVSSN